MLKKRTASAALGIFLSATLCTSLVPLKGTEAHAAELENEALGATDSANTEPDEIGQEALDAIIEDWTSENPETAEELSDDAPQTLEATGTATIVRDGGAVAFNSINEAVGSALDGETVLVEGTHVLAEPIKVTGGKSISLVGKGQAKVARGEGYPQSDGKPDALVLLSEKTSLTVKADSSDDLLSFDGEAKDSNKAIIVVDGGSRFVMGEGSQVENASASWKPWGGVYVRNGSFVLDGGKIVNGFAQKNAAVAVEAGSSFEMRSGEISGNRSTYSEAAIWVKGTFSMTGGSIVDNKANSGASQDGVVYVLDGGSFSFTGGTIGESSVTSSRGIHIKDASFSIGGSARIAGSDRIALKGSSYIDVSSSLTSHNADNPLSVALLDSWGAGRVVAKFSSPEEARQGVASISAVSGGQAAESIPLLIDPTNSSWVSVASGDAAALFDLLDNPYSDNLGFSFKDELLKPGIIESLRAQLDAIYDGISSPDKQSRYERLSYIERQMKYLDENREAVEASVLTLSSLGDPVSDRSRTKQNFQFDNLDATGYYLQPGCVNELYLYVDAEDPSLLSLAWRQAGQTDSDSYTSLNLSQRTNLENGVNKVTVDLTDKNYGYMLFMRNDSTSNAAKVRLEGLDANVQGNPLITGTQLGTHPVYLHDVEHPEKFWDFVLSVREYADKVGAGQAQDMALLQMGDEGRAQYSIRATALAKTYAGIGSSDEARSYIEQSNAAIQERLEFFWAFDGFDKTEESGANAVSRMRVHTAFTINVTSPSNMYATGRYFHMPENTAASFLSGNSMYGWGMSHEYGHVLDNTVLVVNEETNNMYSIAGSRNGEIMASEKAGRAFSASNAYHVNAMRAERLWDEKLQKIAEDPSFTYEWNEGGWGYYIWTHLYAWWNGTHFFDEWDYSEYDHDASPFTEADAQSVERWGAFGATMRILRSDTAAVSKIESVTASIDDATSRKYNRIAMAYTMGIGYNFAEYLEIMGQRDLTEAVKAFCAQYPSMPRKVQYYSLSADAAQINGAKAYEGSVTPSISVEHADGVVSVEASMPTTELTASTIAYELYRNGTLVGFSRTGSFDYDLTGEFLPGEYSVVSYDVRLNPSEMAYAPGEGPEATAEDLKQDIEKATARLAEVMPSADGKDVEGGASWATSEAINALQAAIEDAQKIADTPGLSAADIEDARADLRRALETFNGAVKIKPVLEGITIVSEGGESALKAGDELQLTAVFDPEGSDLPVTWESSANAVAKVDAAGKVLAVSEGTALITATASNGMSASIEVTVVSSETTSPSPGLPAPEEPPADNPPATEPPTEEPPAADSWTNPYEDVEEGTWFYNDVKAMEERGIMTGIGGTALFDPYGTTTRAMAVTTIWRMAGKPSASADLSFSDVNADDWHAEAVLWAASVGVTTGYTDTGLFGPDDQVTREQFATMLARYASVANLESSHHGDLSSFPDVSDVSDWGHDGLAWAVGAGIVRGVDDSHLMPLASAQRSELAAMLNRCIDRFDL